VTPWLCVPLSLRPLPPLRVTGLLLVLGAGAVVGPYGTVLAYGAESRPSATATVSAAGPTASDASGSARPSRAGSLAGEGRVRPGRTEASADEGGDEDEDTAAPDEGDDGGGSDSPSPAASQSPQEAGLVPSAPPLRPVGQTVARAENSAEPMLRILPLGSGLVLIGLGLGLAFIALRVRRG
jgi:hypothetical protein